MNQDTTDGVELVLMLLGDIARGLRSLSQQDLEAVASGRGRLRLSVDQVKPVPTSRHSSRQKVEGALEELVGRLRLLSDRQEGLRTLITEVETRDTLVRLCKLLDVPARKSDKIERLRERIVEATIGYRLRSEAIHGYNNPSR